MGFPLGENSCKRSPYHHNMSERLLRRFQSSTRWHMWAYRPSTVVCQPFFDETPGSLVFFVFFRFFFEPYFEFRISSGECVKAHPQH